MVVVTHLFNSFTQFDRVERGAVTISGASKPFSLKCARTPLVSTFNCLSKSHLISKNSIKAILPKRNQPLYSFDLVRLLHFPSVNRGISSSCYFTILSSSVRSASSVVVPYWDLVSISTTSLFAFLCKNFQSNRSTKYRIVTYTA